AVRARALAPRSEAPAGGGRGSPSRGDSRRARSQLLGELHRPLAAVAETAPKGHAVAVVVPYDQVELGATAVAETALDLDHEEAADRSPPQIRMCGDVVEPYAPAGPSRQGRADDTAALLGAEHEAGLGCLERVEARVRAA